MTNHDAKRTLRIDCVPMIIDFLDSSIMDGPFRPSLPVFRDPVSELDVLENKSAQKWIVHDTLALSHLRGTAKRAIDMLRSLALGD